MTYLCSGALGITRGSTASSNFLMFRTTKLSQVGSKGSTRMVKHPNWFPITMSVGTLSPTIAITAGSLQSSKCFKISGRTFGFFSLCRMNLICSYYSQWCASIPSLSSWLPAELLIAATFFTPNIYVHSSSTAYLILSEKNSLWYGAVKVLSLSKTKYLMPL